MKRMLPSANATLHPPVWKLPKVRPTGASGHRTVVPV
jgi:hypothetical protein